MKSTKYFILLIISLGMLYGALSCTDDWYYDNGQYSRPGNEIIFNVTSGFEDNDKATRSNDPKDLKPVIFTDGKDSLYLHRYVSPEIRRSTGSTGKNSTRSAQINTLADFNTLNKGDGFLVKALFYDNGSDYFPMMTAKPLDDDNTEEDEWFVDPYKYWPGKRELCFQAFAPKASEGLLKNLQMTNEKISFSYTVPVSTASEDSPRNDAEVQPDLMFATSVCSHYGDNGHSDLALLNFRHALSSIKFAIRDVTKWNIVSISIEGVAGSGDCEYTLADGFQWSNRSVPTDYIETFNYETTDPYPNVPGNVDPNTYPTTIPLLNAGMPEKTFMLIPQEIPENAKLKLVLESIPENAGDATVTKTLTGTLRTEDIQEWLPGKEYVYTISTTPINWTYVFEVIGSREIEKVFDVITGTYKAGSFVDDATKIEIDAAVDTGSYYKVRSYRYRTNNPTLTEPLPWTANTSKYGETKAPTEGPTVNEMKNLFNTHKEVIPSFELDSHKWLLKNWVYQGPGTTYDETIHNVPFETYDNLIYARQYVATDYDGDWTLRTNTKKGTSGSPIDLSRVNGTQNTANCYVINAGGWYSIPLYYGNSITNGTEDPKTYTNTDGTQNVKYSGSNITYHSLNYFKDYNGGNITSAAIDPGSGADAVLVWEDAPDIVDSVRYNSTKKSIEFYVHKEFLQQANAVIAIRNSSKKILWSWHIWVSDHWVNNNLTLGNGDVECQCWDDDYGTFTISPYNLGWCDPKNIYYLKREGTITFTQSETGKKITLPVIQRPDYVEYWIGNNTYYQFGRKDPLVGFINASNKLKYNYGPYPYKVEVIKSSIPLQTAIQNPNVMYILQWDIPNRANTDWAQGDYYNLWNNYRGDKFFSGGVITTTINEVQIVSGGPNLENQYGYSANKTIYDPSPAGYKVPGANHFLLFSKGLANPNNNTLHLQDLKPYFNGTITDKSFTTVPSGIDISLYKNYQGYSQRAGNGAKVNFNETGQRYYMNRTTGAGVYLGGTNNNQPMVYFWSCTIDFVDTRSGYAFALGYDDETQHYFNVNSYFTGNKAMGRPVRCIKE